LFGTSPVSFQAMWIESYVESFQEIVTSVGAGSSAGIAAEDAVCPMHANAAASTVHVKRFLLFLPCAPARTGGTTHSARTS